MIVFCSVDSSALVAAHADRLHSTAAQWYVNDPTFPPRQPPGCTSMLYFNAPRRPDSVKLTAKAKSREAPMVSMSGIIEL